MNLQDILIESGLNIANYENFVLIDGENLFNITKGMTNQDEQDDIINYLNTAKIFNESTFFICICKDPKVVAFLHSRIKRDKIIFQCEMYFFNQYDFKKSDGFDKNEVKTFEEFDKNFTCDNISSWKNIVSMLRIRERILHDHVNEFDDHLLVELAIFLKSNGKNISIVTKESKIGNPSKLIYPVSFITIFLNGGKIKFEYKLTQDTLSIKNFKQIEHTTVLEYNLQEAKAAKTVAKTAADELLIKANTWCSDNNLKECNFDVDTINSVIFNKQPLFKHADLYAAYNNLQKANNDEEIKKQWKILIYKAQEVLKENWIQIIRSVGNPNNNKYYHQYLKYKLKYIKLKQSFN